MFFISYIKTTFVCFKIFIVIFNINWLVFSKDALRTWMPWMDGLYGTDINTPQRLTNKQTNRWKRQNFVFRKICFKDGLHLTKNAELIIMMDFNLINHTGCLMNHYLCKGKKLWSYFNLCACTVQVLIISLMKYLTKRTSAI